MSQSVSHQIFDFGFKATADFSTGGTGPASTFQYTAVKLDTAAAFQVDKAGAAGAIGILQNAPKAGGAAEVRLLGMSQMIVDGNAGAIAPNDRLSTDSSGRGIKDTTDKHRCVAIALEASTAANDQIAVLVFGPMDLSV